MPSEAVAELLVRVAERTAAEAPKPREGQSVEERLDQVAEFLAQKGYSARWEACDGYFELYACNCPYSGVAEQHPELCLMDHAMIESLLPGAVRAQSQAINGATRCAYILRPTVSPVAG